MITKDGRNTPIGSLTADNYLVPKGEERFYHTVIEVVQYDPKTGRKISKPRVQKFGAKIFERIVHDNLLKQGYTITILHDPRAYLAEAAKAKAVSAKAAAEAKAKAEQERFDAAVQAAVEKALAAKAAAEKEAPEKEAKKSGGKKKKEDINA